jgi:hypothetical protein
VSGLHELAKPWSVEDLLTISYDEAHYLYFRQLRVTEEDWREYKRIWDEANSGDPRSARGARL